MCDHQFATATNKLSPLSHTRTQTIFSSCSQLLLCSSNGQTCAPPCYFSFSFWESKCIVWMSCNLSPCEHHLMLMTAHAVFDLNIRDTHQVVFSHYFCNESKFQVDKQTAYLSAPNETRVEESLRDDDLFVMAAICNTRKRSKYLLEM